MGGGKHGAQSPINQAKESHLASVLTFQNNFSRLTQNGFWRVGGSRTGGGFSGPLPREFWRCVAFSTV